MTRDPKYLPALISGPGAGPEAPRIPAIEPLRAPRSISLSKPGEKVGSSNLFLAGGARNHAGLRQRKRRQGEKLWLDRPGGLASISGLRSGRIVIPAALTPLESPPLPTPSIPGAAGPGGLALPGVQGPRAGRRQVEGDRLTAARPREAGPGGAAATPALPPPIPRALPPSRNSPRPPAPTLRVVCRPARASAPSVREPRNR